MKNIFAPSLLLLLLLPLALCAKQKQVYIVNLGDHHKDIAVHQIENTHHSFLRLVKKTEAAARLSHLYSYKHSFNGFAAVLTPEEAFKLSKMEGVISVYRTQPGKYTLHTTRSWDFMGLEQPLDPFTKSNQTDGDLLSKAKYGEDVIVGIIDTGVWPDSKSFSDEGMGPVPERWKGICQNGTAFNSSQCNRKIIGARYYLHGYQSVFGLLDENDDYKSARDKDGHGSHVASIIAGRTVPNVTTLGGFASGKASGGAPLARIAIYKACWGAKGSPKHNGNVCEEPDVMKAIDDAIGDGVDVISIAFGYDDPISYAEDVVAKETIHALKNNIVVVSSAGNSGPSPQTVTNLAPWLITVAASSIDRSFPAPLVLENGTRVEGQSIAAAQMENNFQPLVLATDAENSGLFSTDSGYCLDGTLDQNKVKGKIVLCLNGKGDRLKKGFEVQRAGGVGFIVGNNQDNGYDVPYDVHFIPSTGLTYKDTLKLVQYIRSSKNPVVHILPGWTSLNSTPAPSMASFSSRGPNKLDPNILKPDITAPGLGILAAWTDDEGPTRMSDKDHRQTKYSIFSGTSISGPHVTAAVALLKAIHPTWSSSAIKSALMTTAGTTDNTGKPMTDETGDPATPFSMGSGSLRPIQAADPGLVYNTSYMDYVQYTCYLKITQDLNIPYKCPDSSPEPINLNYPSIQVHMLNDTKTITRTVTNVGSCRSTYTFSATAPNEFSISASPDVLEFDHVGQEKSFNITVTTIPWNVPTKYDPDHYYFGSYTWTHEHYVVRSPIAVSFP